MQTKTDIVFLGGGPAGYQGAIRAAQLGAKVTVVEERFVGGVCLNAGCIPTKTVRASAEVGRSIRRAKEYGFQDAAAVPDIASIIARKQRIVTGLRSSIERLFRARKIDLIEGRGRLLAPGRIEIQKDNEARLIEADKVIIATGSRPAGLPIFPKTPRVFLADEMLDITYLPQHLLVVGGGAVGVEMAAIFRELGSVVTLVEALDHILPGEDREMADYLLTLLKRRKVTVLCGTTVKAVAETADGFSVRLADGTEIAADTILQAVGRRFNTEGIGLENVGIRMYDGQIMVDEHLQSNVSGHYAAGDVIGGWMLAHVAFAEGICAAEHALGLDSSMDYRVVPRCVFSVPEYAAVGVSEEEARSKGPIKVARMPFKALGMSQAIGELEGLVKVISHAETDQIMGAHIIGAHGSDLIAEVALAMRAQAPVQTIVSTIHTHPSFSEALLEVAQAIHGKAIHMPP